MDRVCLEEKVGMNKKLLIAVPVVGFLVVIGLVYAFLRAPAAASEPIEAIPITAPTNTTAPVVEAPTAEPTPEVQATAVEEPVVAQPEASQAWIFSIVQSESEARFIIDEILNGQPKTVIGVTDQVAGQIQIDASDLAATRLGVIQVNARTLTTDNESRNRAIKNRILLTDSFEFITFTPSELIGLPASVSAGQPVAFQIAGDLTIRDITLPVTFEAEVTPISETELRGSAFVVILYKDFGIQIPSVPAVAGVDEDVRLEIDFVARR
jgi:polyisoprenoid-binding protein YceI